jgi:NhaA family Na+:H+ antiporter
MVLGGALAVRGLGAALPKGMAPRDLAVVGLVAAMGFSVPLFAIGATLPGGTLSEGARLGLLASLIAAPLALALARAIGRRVA